jgi:hypothetical protein
VKTNLLRAEPGIIRAAEAKAVPEAKRGIMKAGHKTASEVVNAITVSITAAVKNVLGAAALLAILALLVSLFIPNLELRRGPGHSSDSFPAGMG